MSDNLYVGLNLEEETTVSLMGNSITVNYSTMGGGVVGMLPVYASKEDAEKNHKNIEVIKKETQND